jgi:hypothetical protein
MSALVNAKPKAEVTHSNQATLHDSQPAKPPSDNRQAAVSGTEYIFMIFHLSLS